MARDAEEKAAAGGAPVSRPMPTYELSSYEPVAFSMPRMGVSDEQVERKMMEYAERCGAEFTVTNRKVVGPKENLKIDVLITSGGEEVENLTSDDRLYTLGDGLMPVDFDRNLVGMRVGQSKDFDFSAADFEASGGSSESTYHASVTVTAILRKSTPEITDRWVKKYLPMYKSAADFRTQVSKGLREEAARMIEQEKNQRSVAALAERFEGHIDDALYEQTRADLMAKYEQEARSQGMTLRELLEKQGMDDNAFSMTLMYQTHDMLVQGFCLDAWARHYGLEATDDDLLELAEMMAPAGRANEILSHLEKDAESEAAFRLAALRHVANKHLTASAHITYTDGASQG